MLAEILTKLVRVLWIPDYREAFLRTRVAASVEHDHVIDGLSLETIVDIGANRGQFALCARRLYPSASIYSFEPLSRPAGTFREVFRHDPRTHLFQTAIGASPGSASMHVSRWDVSSSLLPFAQAQHNNFPMTEELGLEEVSISRLADCLQAEDVSGTAMLKIDVQGYELNAIAGCRELMDRFSYVYVECSFVPLYEGQALAGEVVEQLARFGFRLAGVANLARGKSNCPIQADFLFARRGNG